VLVAHSYFLRYDAKQLQKMKPYPPLATLMVAAGLRQRGYDVSFFDAMLAQGVEDFESTLAQEQPAVVAIVEDNFNFITKMCTLRMREAALHMIRCAAERGCRVLVNGSDAADHPRFTWKRCNAVVLGERTSPCPSCSMPGRPVLPTSYTSRASPCCAIRVA
jgi:anaerobic magnesium-protoporphyrin IX monomethyl ester cyclase